MRALLRRPARRAPRRLLQPRPRPGRARTRRHPLDGLDRPARLLAQDERARPRRRRAAGRLGARRVPARPPALAALGRGGDPLATFDLADLDWLEQLLFRTVVHSTRAFHDALAASEHGRFVLVSSKQGQDPDGTNAAYGAAKAAAETWTLALADSFRGDESAATANIVVVNAILTPQMREQSPEKPFKSFTSAEEIADAIAFICSDAARKMNGKRLALHP